MSDARELAIFPTRLGARVFALPPGADFIAALVAGLEARLAGHPPEAMARVTIWVNARRAERSLRTALATGPARLLPRIHVLGDLATDPLHAADLPPLVPPLRRKLELSRLVARLMAAPGVTADTAAFDLADSLAELMDELGAEGLAPSALASVDPAEHAAHWQRSLGFLSLIGSCADRMASGEGQARLRAVTDRLARVWADQAPRTPLVVAGSTGSRGGTRAFMALVARQPQGALVLPGLDLDLPPAVWRRLTAEENAQVDHPQAPFAHLARDIGFDPGRIALWHSLESPCPERNALVSLALRPAPVTDQWRSQGASLVPHLAAATAGFTWVEAPDARAEARAIAYALREAAEDRIRAALITPDRTLARRVAAELDRWRLIPDDSAGRPLALTPPGVLLRLVADALRGPLTAEALLALLKHPLVNSAPGARRRHMDLTARLETTSLRGGPPCVSWDALADWARKFGAEDAPGWIAWLDAILTPLAAAARGPLPEMVLRHRWAAEALAAGPEQSAIHGLWQKDAGQACLGLMDELAAEAGAYGEIGPVEYRALLLSQMAGRDVPEEAVVTNAQVAIWGTLEARVQTAELIVLGGLNEGIWPAQPGTDPWLSRSMRREIGLPLPERQIGLAAHDFQQAMGAGRVIATRAARDAEAPTVPSRWLLRLENLMTGLGDGGKAALAAAKGRGRSLLARAARLDTPEAREAPARRPSPRPPVAARPSELSVTQIETLVRDPYAIYARHVLDLRKLDPPGQSPDALTRGSTMHAALQRFVDETAEHLPEEAHEALSAAIEAALAETAPWPAIRALWRSRFARAASWFLAEERERRGFGRPALREVRGRRVLEGVPLPFTVTAKADRIDLTPDGGCAIYDYKSGSIPSEKEIAAFHLQLPLEAAIAAAGGFRGLAATPARRAQLIGMGTRKIAEVACAPDEIAAVWTRLRELIATYQRPETGYTARLRPQRLTYESEYDHLSRKGEWADGDMPEATP
jgi:ATP-dependent helicase/nuclease subunit B